MNRNPIIGIVLIAFGIFCLAFLLIYDVKNLIYQGSEIFIIRITGPLLLINGGIYFIFLGLMFCFGRMVPYYKADRIEKAKHNFYGGLISSPIFISISSVAILNEKLMWKFLGLAFLGIYLYILISGFSALQKDKHT